MPSGYSKSLELLSVLSLGLGFNFYKRGIIITTKIIILIPQDFEKIK